MLRASQPNDQTRQIQSPNPAPVHHQTHTLTVRYVGRTCTTRHESWPKRQAQLESRQRRRSCLSPFAPSCPPPRLPFFLSLRSLFGIAQSRREPVPACLACTPVSLSLCLSVYWSLCLYCFDLSCLCRRRHRYARGSSRRGGGTRQTVSKRQCGTQRS
jgi:hypothetical protein